MDRPGQAKSATATSDSSVGVGVPSQAITESVRREVGSSRPKVRQTGGRVPIKGWQSRYTNYKHRGFRLQTDDRRASAVVEESQ